MPLGDRIKQLRTELGLSQAELAQHVGSTDARQISRYENGRITPSLDAVARLAQALDVSLDYLVFDDQPRRPLHIDDHGLAERLAALAELNPEDRASLLSVLDALLTRTRPRPRPRPRRQLNAPAAAFSYCLTAARARWAGPRIAALANVPSSTIVRSPASELPRSITGSIRSLSSATSSSTRWSSGIW